VKPCSAREFTLKLAHSSAKEDGFVTEKLIFNQQNRETPTIYIPPQFASHSLPDSSIPGRPACRPQTGLAEKQSSSRAQKPGPINVATNGGSPESRPFPPFLRKVLFPKDAHTIAKSLASNRVSAKGPGSGMRMPTYFINRAGRGLSPSRRKVLERAKRILSPRTERQKTHERREA
jgi:uncharacterized protein DUF3175